MYFRYYEIMKKFIDEYFRELYFSSNDNNILSDDLNVHITRKWSSRKHTVYF